MNKVVATMAFVALITAPAACFAKGSSSHSVTTSVSAKGSTSVTIKDSSSTGTSTAAKVGHDLTAPKLTAKGANLYGGEMSNPRMPSPYTDNGELGKLKVNPPSKTDVDRINQLKVETNEVLQRAMQWEKDHRQVPKNGQINGAGNVPPLKYPYK